MNILVLSPWLPWPPFGGALIRILETLRWIAERHRVTLLALLRDPEQEQYVKELNGLCERVITTMLSDDTPSVLRRLSAGLVRGRPLIQSMHYNRTMADHLWSLTSQNHYDIIHVEFSFMAPYLDSVNPLSQARRVLVMHNVETRRFSRELRFANGTRRLALLTDHLLFKTWEEEAVRRFHGIVAVSPLEQHWIREQVPDAAIAVLPNGVNITQFAPADTTGGSRTIVFTGLMNYPPNIDAVIWFCNAVLPIIHRTHPEVQFTIVGDKPTRPVLALRSRRGVTVTGRVPDVRPYLADCLGLIVPVRSGAGTRLKILEAMAMRRPVVSTPVGAEGLDVVHGRNILLGETPEALAAQVVSLIEDPALSERVGSAGRELVQTTYDWRICLDGLGDLYQSLARATPASPTARSKVS
jgi:sugar transferase (PEP-CTERM/EpsH1 system associated)